MRQVEKEKIEWESISVDIDEDREANIMNVDK